MNDDMFDGVARHFVATVQTQAGIKPLSERRPMFWQKLAAPLPKPQVIIPLLPSGGGQMSCGRRLSGWQPNQLRNHWRSKP